MATASSAPVSTGENNTSQFISSTPYEVTIEHSNIEGFLENKNHEFVKRLVPSLIYLVFGVLLGVVGNTVVFVVYYRRFKPSVTRTYILAMSVCDLMQNVLSLPADVVEIRFRNTFELGWLCKIFRTMKSFLTVLSAYLLVAVAFDRQRAICSPETNPTSVKHAVGVVIVVSVASFASVAPHIVFVGPKTVRYDDSTITGLECTYDDDYTDSLFLFIYNLISLTGLGMCFVLMLLSYIRIARQLWLHKKNMAIIMKSAVVQDKKKAGDRNSHNKTQHDKSSGSPQKSSVGNVPFSGTKTNLCKGNLQLSYQGDITQEHTTLKNAHTETAQNLVEDADRICPAPSTDSAEETGSPLSRSSGTKVANLQNGMEADHLGACDTIVSSSETRNNTRQDSAQINMKASSDSRSVLTKLRQLANDAKVFVRRKKPAPKPLGSAKKIPNRTTLMMFVLTVIFILNYLPHLGLVTVRSGYGESPIIEAIGVNVYEIGLRSYFINSFINPLVYSFCSVRFRQECRELFNCKAK